MIPRDDIQKILEAGVQAPSGSNSQPWEFKIRDNWIYIFALPEKDHPVLNYRYRGTWVAHGALIENIVIASSALGYEAKTNIFPDRNEPKLTAIIDLKKTKSKEETLYPYIFQRCTNRKSYEITPLTSNQKAEILNTQKEIEGVELKLIDEPETLKIAGNVLSTNEIVMFGNKILHRLFFKELVWEKGEEKDGGLYTKTLELKLPQEFMLRIIKHWPIMKIMNSLGIARSIAAENAKVYSSSAAVGALIVDDKDENFINAGRMIERIWLKAGKMGLSFHLLTGVLFLWQRITNGETEGFSEEHVNMVKGAYQNLAQIFGVDQGIIALIFRIGEDGQPSARSEKLSPKIS